MPSGILVIDKPQGWTSMDVCAKVRGILHEKKVGHAGTLDPLATGVLPVFVGQATKAISFAETSEKKYVATLRLGVTTDTQDSTGRILSETERSISLEELQTILPQYTGEISQIPPMYSAVSIHGQKLYKLARKGLEVERTPRNIVISELEVVKQLSDNRYLLRIRCSKGTYIRTLCHDIGQALGVGGTMETLRRTEAAGFSLSQAITLDDLQVGGPALLLPLDSFFSSYPSYDLTPEQEKKVLCGNPIPCATDVKGYFRVYGTNGSFLCLSRGDGQMLTSMKNFFGASE